VLGTPTSNRIGQRVREGNGKCRGDSLPQCETWDPQRDGNDTAAAWVDDGGSGDCTGNGGERGHSKPKERRGNGGESL
jgi:hypothetical protein